MKRSDVIITLISNGFVQVVEGNGDGTPPIVSYRKPYGFHGLTTIYLLPHGRYLCQVFENKELVPALSIFVPRGEVIHHAVMKSSRQVLKFAIAENLIKTPQTHHAPVDLEFTLDGLWEYIKDMGEFGRLDTFITVQNHPQFDALRYYFFPGGGKEGKQGGDCMEWVKDEYHFTNGEAPVPDEVRKQVMEVIIEDLKKRLNASKA